MTVLSRFKVKGMVGRFVVDREALEQVLQNRKQEDGFCRNDVTLQLPQSLAPSAYNASQEGEIFLYHGTVTDCTLSKELTNDLKEQVATTHRFLTVEMPVVIGKSEKHGVLILSVFTDSKKKVMNPYPTSNQEIIYVDSMEEAKDGTVMLQIGDDAIAYKVQNEVNDRLEKDVGKDFDAATGKVVTLTSYPLPFDWGCDFMGTQISFCRALEEFKCELAAVGGDVCVELQTTSSKRVPASMKVVNMTGIFRDMFPFLAEGVPSESFEAELIDREHTTGITLPCLTS
ncbi:hypothetical protein HOLleu_13752 [Holothuria leucospilota]|uniref:Uncharacterized protein n=1 Tax=Holothuria leucospilota TaxID=206669 RepID=A0A9Q1HBS7_HOLLE|nr:hypothetical protein HOLleu_13752 [Holothuria leucospilota]